MRKTQLAGWHRVIRGGGGGGWGGWGPPIFQRKQGCAQGDGTDAGVPIAKLRLKKKGKMAEGEKGRDLRMAPPQTEYWKDKVRGLRDETFYTA